MHLFSDLITLVKKLAAASIIGWAIACSAAAIEPEVLIAPNLSIAYPVFSSAIKSSSFSGKTTHGKEKLTICTADSPIEGCMNSGAENLPPESFQIVERSDAIYVIGSDERGAIYGTSYLQQQEASGRTLMFPYTSSPDHAIRAVHIVIRYLSVRDAMRLVDQARLSRFNTVIIQLTDFVNLGIPGWPTVEKAWSISDLQRFITYARDSGMDVIPEVKLLTHQEKFFAAAFPQLMYNKVTYDPRIPEVYERVFTYLEKVIEVTQPAVIHIGHDEAFGFSKRTHDKWLRPGEEPLPADLFLADTVKIQEWLEERDIEVWMWGDMLVSAEEPQFSVMFPNELHGWGAYPSIRNSIPKSIVIVDWHYSDKQICFPTISVLKESGHSVLGSTWDRRSTITRFSQVADSAGARGMVQTLWNYVQKKKWNEINQMLDYAGAVYWDTGELESIAKECGLAAT